MGLGGERFIWTGDWSFRIGGGLIQFGGRARICLGGCPLSISSKIAPRKW